LKIVLKRRFCYLDLKVLGVYSDVFKASLTNYLYRELYVGIYRVSHEVLTNEITCSLINIFLLFFYIYIQLTIALYV